MSGPQKAHEPTTLAASPSKLLEPACRKARSRLPPVRSAISAISAVGTRSAGRARSSAGIVAWHARYHPAAEDRRPTARLPSASARNHGALRGGPRQSRDPLRRYRRRGARVPDPPPCPGGTSRLPRLRASLSWLCPVEMPRVRRNASRGFQLQGARVLPVVHGPAHVRDRREPDQARAAARNPASSVGADLPVPVETTPRAGARSLPSGHGELLGRLTQIFVETVQAFYVRRDREAP